MKHILLFLILVLFAGTATGQDSLRIISKWKLISYDAFEKVKTSPGYMLSTEEERQLVDKTSKLLLDSVQYEFKQDGLLVYKDLENLAIVERTAYWMLKGDILFINELKRPYSRQAKIIELSEHKLIITPIINGQVGDSKMIFTKM